MYVTGHCQHPRRAALPPHLRRFLMLGIAEKLLPWFEQNRRVLPFRQDPTPYHIWISEIMLQQTRMTAAVPYYERFIAELPDPPPWPPVTRTGCASCGRGWATTAAPPTCKRRPSCCASSTAGSCRPVSTPCGRCRASGITRRGRSPASDSACRLRRWTAMCCGCLPGCNNDDADVTRPETKRQFTARVMEEQPADRPGDFNQALMELGGAGLSAQRRAAVRPLPRGGHSAAGGPPAGRNSCR